MKQQQTPRDVLRRYPRLCAHLICESLGYATPTVAASILLAAICHEPHHCEWIHSCYGGQPLRAVRETIRHRRYHQGYMAYYPEALALVLRTIRTSREPVLASWF